eukprot:44387-Hanusia_phi.AAC.1
MSTLDLKTVAMIDGNRLQLTPLGKMLVPPPMAAVTVELHAPISSVCWGPAGDLAVLCSDASLCILEKPFGGEEGGRWSRVPKVETKLEGNMCPRVFQLVWLRRSLLLAICCRPAPALFPLLLREKEGGSWKMELGDKVETSAPVSRLLREERRNGCLVQLSDGQVLQAECVGEVNRITTKSIGKLPSVCCKLMIPVGQC